MVSFSYSPYSGHEYLISLLRWKILSAEIIAFEMNAYCNELIKMKIYDLVDQNIA